jgi:hypothetical protein
MYRQLLNDLPLETLIQNANRLEVAVQEAEKMLIELEEQQIELEATNEMLRGSYKMLTDTSSNFNLFGIKQRVLKMVKEYVNNLIPDDGEKVEFSANVE